MADDLLHNYRWLARYNTWFNLRLYGACESLDDAQRKQDRGAFFGSIHRTLNHLIVADQIWLLRMRQCALDHYFESQVLNRELLDLPSGSDLNSLLYEEWTALRAKRTQMDTAVEAWLAEMPVQFLQWVMRYSSSAGVARVHPAWMALSHFFNHQTHHRGQVTTLLMQAGVDVGVTDMIVLTGAVDRVDL